MIVHAAHPTLVVALGRLRSVAMAAVRKFDTDLDPDQEIGVRVVLSGLRPEAAPAWVVTRPGSSIDDLCAQQLEALLDPKVGDLVPPEDGLRLVMLVENGDELDAARLLAAIERRVSDMGLSEPLRGRRGVAVRIVLVGIGRRALRQGWSSFRRIDELRSGVAADTQVPGPIARPSCIAIARDQAGRRLSTEEHDEAVACATRLLCVEAPGLEDRLLLDRVAYGFQRWELVEILDEASSIESARERQRLARYVDGFVSHPGNERVRRDRLSAERILDAWLRRDRPATVTSSNAPDRESEVPRDLLGAVAQGDDRQDESLVVGWRAADETLKIEAAAVAASIKASEGIDQPGWVEDVPKRLRRALEVELSRKGDRFADANLASLETSRKDPDGREVLVDLVELDALHPSLGECGTDRLVRELREVEIGLVHSRELLGPTPASRRVDDGSAALARLPELQKRWIEDVGPEPPASHWLQLLWMVLGVIAAPLLQDLARDAIPGAGVGRDLVWVARWLFHAANRDAGAALFGAAIGWGMFALWQRYLRRNWELQSRALRGEVEAVMAEAAAASLRLEAERHRLLLRTQATVLARVDVALHWLRRRARAVAETQRHAVWLRERILKNLPAAPREPAWRLRRRVGTVSWALVPPAPSAESDRGDTVSPWADFERFRPFDDDARAPEFFLWPLEVREAWRDRMARTELPALEVRGQPIDRASIDEARGRRLDAEAGTVEEYYALAGARFVRRVGEILPDGAGSISMFAPSNVPLHELRTITEDRLTVLSVVRDLPGGSQHGL